MVQPYDKNEVKRIVKITKHNKPIIREVSGKQPKKIAGLIADEHPFLRKSEIKEAEAFFYTNTLFSHDFV